MRVFSQRSTDVERIPGGSITHIYTAKTSRALFSRSSATYVFRDRSLQVAHAAAADFLTPVLWQEGTSDIRRVCLLMIVV